MSYFSSIFILLIAAGFVFVPVVMVWNLDLVRRIGEIAREKGCTPSQLALAWVMAQGDDVVPNPFGHHV